MNILGVWTTWIKLPLHTKNGGLGQTGLCNMCEWHDHRHPMSRTILISVTSKQSPAWPHGTRDPWPALLRNKLNIKVLLIELMGVARRVACQDHWAWLTMRDLQPISNYCRSQRNFFNRIEKQTRKCENDGEGWFSVACVCGSRGWEIETD